MTKQPFNYEGLARPAFARYTDVLAFHWRKIVIALVCLALGVLAVLSTSHDPGAKGRVVDAGTGEPLKGAVVRATWFARKEFAFESTGKYKPSFNVPNTRDIRDSNLATREVTVDADGRFEIEPLWLVRDPRFNGPFLRLSLEAADRYTAARYDVERFRLADGVVVDHAYDESALTGAIRTELLSELAVLARGQRQSISVADGLSASAEGSAGVRIFDTSVEPPKLTAHVLPDKLGGEAIQVHFGRIGLHVFTGKSWRVLEPKTGSILAGLEGPYYRLLGRLGGRLAIAQTDRKVGLFEPGIPPRLIQELDLREHTDDSDPKPRNCFNFHNINVRKIYYLRFNALRKGTRNWVWLVFLNVINSH